MGGASSRLRPFNFCLQAHSMGLTYLHHVARFTTSDQTQRSERAMSEINIVVLVHEDRKGEIDKIADEAHSRRAEDRLKTNYPRNNIWGR